MPACAACGTENLAGRKFCGGCGAPLVVRLDAVPWIERVDALAATVPTAR